MKNKALKLAATALALAFVAPSAWAQSQGQRLAGTIVSVDGPTVLLKTDKGDVKVRLAEKGQILAYEKVTMDGIKVGEFAGVGAMPQADGTLRAIRINIFDEARRGNNEGERPGWGTGGKGTMINATVNTAVRSVDGQVLTLKYKDGEKKIIVPPDALIQRTVAGNAADLKAGAAVTVNAAEPKGEGMFETARINVGRNGYVPQ